MGDRVSSLVQALLAELGQGADARASGFAQPYPITVGRAIDVAPNQSGVIQLLNVGTLPLLGRVWCVNVQATADATASPGVAPVTGIVSIPTTNWLSLRLRWKLGATVSYVADVDLVAGSSSFSLLCDAVQVEAVNAPPSNPAPAGTPTITLAVSLGHDGARPTSLPRRTVFLGTVVKTSQKLAAIPARACEVTVGSIDNGGGVATSAPIAVSLRWFDWLGNVLGSAFMSATSTPRPIDVPQGASIVEVTNATGTDATVTLVFRISL